MPTLTGESELNICVFPCFGLPKNISLRVQIEVLVFPSSPVISSVWGVVLSSIFCIRLSFCYQKRGNTQREMSSLTLGLRSIVQWRILAYISGKSSEIALNGQAICHKERALYPGYYYTTTDMLSTLFPE
jgi:hypothetical protein